MYVKKNPSNFFTFSAILRIYFLVCTLPRHTAEHASYCKFVFIFYWWHKNSANILLNSRL